VHRHLCLVVISVLLAACGSEGGPDPRDEGPVPGTVDFNADLVNLFLTRSTAVTLYNGTDEAVSGVGFGVGATYDARGVSVGGVTGAPLPPFAPTIPPGGAVSVSVGLRGSSLPAGHYETSFEARQGAEVIASVRLRFEVRAGSSSSAVSVRIVDGPTSPRQGDPAAYIAEARNNRDSILPPAFIEWFRLPVFSGALFQDGTFVPYDTGPAIIIARSGLYFDTLDIQIAPRGVSGSLSVVGRNAGTRALAASVSGSTAWLGTDDGSLEAWDVSAPGAPIPSGSLDLTAASVPTVHVRADGQLGAAGLVDAEDGDDGVVLFDPTDPGQPNVLSRFTDGLEAGVADVYLAGDLLFAVREGGGVRIIDVSDPSTPVGLSTYNLGTSFANEVVVHDGLLYVAYWNAGGRVVDVGNGVVGGSPDNPVEAAFMIPPGGQNGHIAILPEKGVALLSGVDPGTPGVVQVVEIPETGGGDELGTWALDELPPGPVAVNAAGDRVVAAWGRGGVRLLDATGDLLGELERQGRELAVALYDGADTNAVTLDLVGDLVYVVDGSGELVILRIG